jgi:hypothetical protein
MPFEGGPYIQAACLCEKVIEEKTGVLSLIRIIDVVTHSVTGPSSPEQMPPVLFNFVLVLMLKSGRAAGRYDLKIVPELPSGETQDPFIISVHFEGEEKGQNVVTNMQFLFTQEGLYWFNVYLGGEKWTAIPFRVKYHRTVTGPPHS